MKESEIPANVAPVPNSASSAVQIYDPLLPDPLKKRAKRATEMLKRLMKAK